MKFEQSPLPRKSESTVFEDTFPVSKKNSPKVTSQVDSSKSVFERLFPVADKKYKDIKLKENKTALNNFVGKSAQGQKRYLEDTFVVKSRIGKLAKFEQEIPAEIESAIEEINELLVTFLQEWGLKEFTRIDARNIVLGDLASDEELRESHRGTAGSYYGHKTRILMLTEWKLGNYQSFVKTLVHEMVHMQAYQSWQQLNIRSNRHRRQGFRIYHDNNGSPESFAWLDEAITETLTKRFMEKHQNSISILNGFKKPLIIAEKIHNWHPLRDGHAYTEQRNFLERVITDIYSKEGSKYRSRDEVLKLFTQAALNGRLLPVARAIEKAKGRGSFKKLSELDINMDPKNE